MKVEMRWLKGVSKRGEQSIIVRHGGDWPDEFYTLQFRYLKDVEWDEYGGEHRTVWSDWEDVEVAEDRR